MPHVTPIRRNNFRFTDKCNWYKIRDFDRFMEPLLIEFCKINNSGTPISKDIFTEFSRKYTQVCYVIPYHINA